MEKFALLNLLKALETISAPKNTGENGKQPESQPNPQPEEKPRETTETNEVQQLNVMSSVLERHEAMAYRIKNKRSV